MIAQMSQELRLMRTNGLLCKQNILAPCIEWSEEVKEITIIFFNYYRAGSSHEIQIC